VVAEHPVIPNLFSIFEGSLMAHRDQNDGQTLGAFPMNVVGWAKKFAPGTASLAAGALALLAVGLFGWRAGLGPRQILELGGAVL
jgi:hypothetical protein